MKLVSIVVPCYNEEKVLPLFYAEITKVMSQMQEKYPELDFELLFINDGSKDGTLQEFRKMATMDHRGAVCFFLQKLWERSRYVCRAAARKG